MRDLAASWPRGLAIGPSSAMTEEAIPEHGEAASQCDTSATHECDRYDTKLIAGLRSPRVQSSKLLGRHVVVCWGYDICADGIKLITRYIEQASSR